MKYTAGQAAKAVGVATSTITNALKSGKISGEKDDNGAWQIDPAELHRVYPPKDEIERDARRGEGPENRGLERLVAVLEAQIADLREDRDRWRVQAERILPAPGSLAVEPPAAWPSWLMRLFGR